jgi:hypothetical protein
MSVPDGNHGDLGEPSCPPPDCNTDWSVISRSRKTCFAISRLPKAIAVFATVPDQPATAKAIAARQL